MSRGCVFRRRRSRYDERAVAAEERNTDTQDAIVEIIRRISGKDVSPAADEPLFDSGVLDSFALVDVVAALEQRFSIEIPDGDLHPQKFATVARIRDYIEKR